MLSGTQSTKKLTRLSRSSECKCLNLEYCAYIVYIQTCWCSDYSHLHTTQAPIWAASRRMSNAVWHVSYRVILFQESLFLV